MVWTMCGVGWGEILNKRVQRGTYRKGVVGSCLCSKNRLKNLPKDMLFLMEILHQENAVHS